MRTFFFALVYELGRLDTSRSHDVKVAAGVKA